MMKFNKWEWEIIKHRLECCDGLYESLFLYQEETGLSPDMTRDEVYEFCFKKMLPTNGKVDFELNENEMRILIDCMEGSTMLVDGDEIKRYPEDYGLTKSQAYSLFRSARSLEERFDVEIPRR